MRWRYMKTGDIMELDRDISRLEKELSNLYRKRMSLLESEIQSSKARVESLAGAVPSPATARSAAGASVAPVVPKVEKPRRKPKKAAKRTRMSTAEVERRLIETVKAAGSEGISLIGISQEAGLNYQTTAKKLKEMSDQFVKKGELKEARYTLKG